MISRSLLAPVLVLLCLGGAPPAVAHDTPRLRDLHAAFDAADAGSLDLVQAARYARDPLYPWLQASILRRQLPTAEPATVLSYLDSGGL